MVNCCNYSFKRTHNTSMNVYWFFTKVRYKYNFCTINENKVQQQKIALTALLLLVKFGTCKHMRMRQK